MNTSDLVTVLAENWDMTQAEVREFLDAVTQTFTENIASGNSFTIPELGTFSTTTRKKRKSFNPHYEQYMELPPKRVVDFNPSKGLKEDFKQVDTDDE
jgi:nucleoid DNA-binding protein